MASQMDSPYYAATSGEALAKFRLVRFDSSNDFVYCDGGEIPVGRTSEAVANATETTAMLLNKMGTMKVVASGAIGAKADVFTDDDGKVTATDTGVKVGVNGHYLRS